MRRLRRPVGEGGLSGGWRLQAQQLKLQASSGHQGLRRRSVVLPLELQAPGSEGSEGSESLLHWAHLPWAHLLRPSARLLPPPPASQQLPVVNLN